MCLMGYGQVPKILPHYKTYSKVKLWLYSAFRCEHECEWINKLGICPVCAQPQYLHDS